MPRIRIAYELPTFNCAFTINFGGDADAARMLREVSNEAKRAGLPPAALFTKTVLEGPDAAAGRDRSFYPPAGFGGARHPVEPARRSQPT